MCSVQNAKLDVTRTLEEREREREKLIEAIVESNDLRVSKNSQEALEWGRL